MSEEEKQNNEMTISISKDKLWKYSTFILLAVVVIGGFIMFTGDNGNTGTTGNVVAPTGNGNTGGSAVSASIDNDAVLGNKDAKVTIIEFSDYQCPFCERFWSQTLPLIKSEYIDTGKVKFVFRDFPLTSIHPQAQKAAEATECVKKQGGDEAFYEMHDKIYENQAQLSESNLKVWAKELGYDISTCLDSGEMRAEVSKDLADAQAAGGRGTPYFVINGQALSGAQPFSAFQQVIEAELAKA